MSVEAFFARASLAAWADKAARVERDTAAFVARHAGAGRRVLLITSGGTAVPLERNVVRYLDNFSTGTRGAALCEAALAHEDACVVFLHRVDSKLPFSRLPADPAALADRVTVVDDQHVRLSDAAVVAATRAFDLARDRLLRVEFFSVDEYLLLLRTTARAVAANCGAPRRSVALLAAAVSDFFVPEPAEHKIQSSAHGDGLRLVLEPVPKMIGVLVRDWFAEQLVVSFKLETDASMLVGKVNRTLARDGQFAVVSNLLQTRYDRVSVTLRDGGEPTDLHRTADAGVEVPLIAKVLEWLR